MLLQKLFQGNMAEKHSENWKQGLNYDKKNIDSL